MSNIGDREVFFGFLVLLLLCGMIEMAFGQGYRTYEHPPAGQHDPYVGIKNKDGESCCNGQDCRQALPEELFDILREGGYRVRAGSDIPPGTFIEEGKTANSPDGNWHVCMSGSWDGTRWNARGGTVRCLMLPNGGV